MIERIGRNVQELRRRKKLTQGKLAELAELDIRTVQKIEAAELNLLITTLERIREAIGCRWDELLGK